MINHHSITINAAPDLIFPHLVTWGESEWWPSKCRMRYTRLTGGEVAVCTRYNQKVKFPFGPTWDVEVESIVENREISRKFLNGMFRGVERLYMIPVPGGTEVHFLMDYEVVGWLNNFLWKKKLEAMHDKNIAVILGALKAHIEGGSPEDYADEAASIDHSRRDFLRRFVRR